MITQNGVSLQPTAGQVFATRGAAVTPSDNAALPDITRYVYVGGTGDLSVVFEGDPSSTPVVLKAVPAGSVLPIAVTLVRSTLTTATNIVALF